MIRKARIPDVKAIQKLINSFARKDEMLPRSLNELYENLRDFWVFEERGTIVGCCALHACWDDLVEIKSLAVSPGRQHMGLGRRLVEACLAEARDIGACSVFVLTYRPSFFTPFGFKKIKTSALPHKIWAECINCPKFPDCQETALIKRL